MEVYTVRSLSFTYPEQTKPVLSGVSFTVRPGEFITLVGPSGCGKTSLLRQLKTVLAPHGTGSGEILFEGAPLHEVPAARQAARIGFVQQNPDNQIVTDKVWHELAFGLESLGCDTALIRSRVAEIASFFGIESWFYQDVSALSGGQKQLLNLAAVMVMRPSVLILDEPSAQLDPIAAGDFLSMLGKINRELGTTVILTEHRLDEVFPLCSRVLVLEEGRLVGDAPPGETGTRLRSRGDALFMAMPAPMRIWAAVENDLPCPVTVPQGRAWLDELASGRALQPPSTAPDPAPERADQPAVELHEVWYRYEKEGADVVKGLSLKAYPGDFLCILGGNGTGKTTALSLISGMNKPHRGQVKTHGLSVAALPQNPQMLFVKKTVYEDLAHMLPRGQVETAEGQEKIAAVAALCRLGKLLNRHPYDLSGGEQQRAALAKVLLLSPRVLLLDEPTKGLDAEFKQTFAAIIRRLTRGGVCVIMVSHDIEFCAEYGQCCALFFDGNIISQNTPRALFAGSSFYTTAANRMARHLLPEAVTAADVISACGGQPPQDPPEPDCDPGGAYFALPAKAEPFKPASSQGRLPLWRRLLGAVSGIVALAAFIYALKGVNFTQMLTTGNPITAGGNHWTVYVVLLAALVVLTLSVSRKTERDRRLKKDRRARLPKRTVAAIIMVFVAIPLTIWAGVYLLGDRKYYFISLLIILETMLPFFLVFAGRGPQARELVIIAALCALGAAGRAAFIALPAFKPVTAVVIITGVAFSAEAGFLVGAMTMLVSNMLFSQGTWTPWQMFAMGLIGLLAGVFFKKGLLRPDRLSLSIFGALAAVVIYGGIMNPAAILIYQSNPTWQMFLTAYAVGFPADLVHGASTAIFLWLISKPMLEKLDRIKVKYGLMDPGGLDHLPGRQKAAANDPGPLTKAGPAAGR